MGSIFSLKYFRLNPFHYLLMAFSLLYFAGTTQFTATDQGLAIVFLIYASVFFLSGHKLDSQFGTITIVYVLVNIIPILYFQSLPNLSTFIGFYLRVASGYFLVKTVGEPILLIFEDLIVKSAIISLPLYFVQITFPTFFHFFSNVNFSFGLQQSEARSINIIIFHINGWSPDRNSGFMWEPGVYGMVLGLAIILNLIRNYFKFTPPFFLLLIVAITTMSTTTYICLLIISVFILFNKDIKNKFILVPIVVAAFAYTLQQSFLTDKIIDSYDQGYSLAQKNLNFARYQHINRFGGFIINIKEFIKFPLGYTFLVEYRTQTAIGSLGSANGLSEFIQMWGIFGIIFLYKAIKGFFKNLQRKYYFKGIIIPAIVFLLYISSNPVTRTPLFFALMLLPLLKMRTKKKYNNSSVVPKVMQAKQIID